MGLTTENVACGLVDKAPLQQGLPQDNDLYLVIEGHDAEEDGDGGSWRWKVAQWQQQWRRMMGGRGILLNVENLIPT